MASGQKVFPMYPNCQAKIGWTKLAGEFAPAALKAELVERPAAKANETRITSESILATANRDLEFVSNIECSIPFAAILGLISENDAMAC